MSQYLCAQCSQPVLHSPPIFRQGAVYCQTCGYALFQGSTSVPVMSQSYTGAVFPNGGSQTTVNSTAALSLWMCPTCQYAYNTVRDHQQCQRCGSYNPASLPQNANMGYAAGQQSASVCFWTCPHCRNPQCPSTHPTCPLCGSSPPTPPPSTWLCHLCSHSNHDKNEYCNQCGGRRLTEIKVFLQGNDKWMCSCGTATSMKMSKCRGCGEFNTAIDKLKVAFGLK